MNKEIFSTLVVLTRLGAFLFGVIQLQQEWPENPKVEEPVLMTDDKPLISAETTAEIVGDNSELL